MTFDDTKEKWSGKVNELTLSGKLKIGGETSLSYHRFEGSYPNRPAVALEVTDIFPAGWPANLREAIGTDVLNNPALWAGKCEKDFNADMIFFNMTGTHQDKENITPDKASETMNEILKTVSVPVIVKPAGNVEKVNNVFTKCASSAVRQIIIGSAVQENYRTISAVAQAGNHFIIAESPIDVNIAKQLNILLTQGNFPLDKIIIDPMTGGLGYGLEYTYSVMERIRLQTFNDDKMMTPPLICLVGPEVWKVKEIKLDDPNLGDKNERGIVWEVSTAVSLILSGADIVAVRHPESVKRIKEFIESLYK
jgi:acetyl-CoA decarbonylase/synthase, CODH/ACS complex subunit delta